MVTIRVHFERLRDAPIPNYLGARGVYAIWDARAKARPTYIGEGNILRRLTDHVERDGRTFAHPWDGYVSALRGSTSNVHKHDARTVECLLLEVAAQTDRAPGGNQRGGTLASVLRYLARETVRVAVTGFDPLLPPAQSRVLRSPKEIKLRWYASGEIGLEYDWRRRRLGAPIVETNTSLERTRGRQSAKLRWRRVRRSAQLLDRHRGGSVKPQHAMAALLVTLTLCSNSYCGDANVDLRFVKGVPGTDKVVPTLAVTIGDKFGVSIQQRGVTDGDHSLRVMVFDGNGREVIQLSKTVTARSGRWAYMHLLTPDGSRDAPGQWNFVLELDNKPLRTDVIVVSKYETDK